MNPLYFLSLLLILPLAIPTADAQTTINVGETQPCFMPDHDPDGDGVYEWESVRDVTSMWVDCGADEDFIAFALLPWEWITGGWFTMIVVSIFILITYVKYQNFLYPALIGIMFVPVSYTLFPEDWLQTSMVLLAVGIGGYIVHMLVKRTNDMD